MRPRFTALATYSASEVADALRKIGINGYIPGIIPHSPLPFGGDRLVGPIYPVKFVDASDKESPSHTSHYMDSAPEGSVVLVDTPDTAFNAVMGGLVARRGIHRGIAGCVVSGLIRDGEELRLMGLKVFARGTSCLGAGGFVRCSSVEQPISLPNGSNSTLLVYPGDILVGDADGITICPAKEVDQVARLCAEIVATDGRIDQEVIGGMALTEAFAKHR